MTTSTTSDTELLTEHFGYPPVSLIDDIINSVNILAERALNSVEQGLLNAPPSSLGFKPASKSKSKSQRQKKDDHDANNPEGVDPAEQAKTEIEAGTHQLETLLCASIDRNFDKFEIYVLRNVLCVKPADVRDWMRLSHYEGLDFTSISPPSTTTGDAANSNRMDVDVDVDMPTLDSINLLRRKLRESMRLNALLTAERARNEHLLSSLRGLVGGGTPVKSEASSPAASKTGKRASTSAPPEPAPAPLNRDDSPFAFLHHKADLANAGGATPLSTTTAFTLSQMQALRSLSASLRTLTPDLLAKPQPQEHTPESESTSEGGDEAGKEKKKSWRRERLEYVEAATRRHLEAVQGLELGRHGEVRDGEWQGGGKGLARGEVEGLERVVGLLGGGDHADANDNNNGGVAKTPAAKKMKPPASASRTRSARKAATAAAGTGAGAGVGNDDDKMDES